MRQMPVQVHERDRYGHFRGVFACIGPVDGPVRALGFQQGKFIRSTKPGRSNRQHGEKVLGEVKQDAPPEAQIHSCVCKDETIGHGL